LLPVPHNVELRSCCVLMLSDITQLKVQEVADSSNCWFGSIFRAGVSPGAKDNRTSVDRVCSLHGNGLSWQELGVGKCDKNKRIRDGSPFIVDLTTWRSP